jgi:hypothetical protein
LAIQFVEPQFCLIHASMLLLACCTGAAFNVLCAAVIWVWAWASVIDDAVIAFNWPDAVVKAVEIVCQSDVSELGTFASPDWIEDDRVLMSDLRVATLLDVLLLIACISDLIDAISCCTCEHALAVLAPEAAVVVDELLLLDELHAVPRTRTPASTRPMDPRRRRDAAMSLPP